MTKHGWYQSNKFPHLYGLFINGQFIGELHNQMPPGISDDGMLYIEPQIPDNFQYSKCTQATQDYFPLPEIINKAKPHDKDQPHPYFMSYRVIGDVYTYDLDDFPKFFASIRLTESAVKQGIIYPIKYSPLELFLDD